MINHERQIAMFQYHLDYTDLSLPQQMKHRTTAVKLV